VGQARAPAPPLTNYLTRVTLAFGFFAFHLVASALNDFLIEASALALSAVSLAIVASFARTTASEASLASASAFAEAAFSAASAVAEAVFSAANAASEEALAATASEAAFTTAASEIALAASAASLAAVCAASSDTRSRTVISANGASARAGKPTTSAVVASPAVVGLNVISDRVPVAGSVATNFATPKSESVAPVVTVAVSITAVEANTVAVIDLADTLFPNVSVAVTEISCFVPAAPAVGATSGSSSLTIATGTGTTATFYVYTKTTAIGTVVITNGGTTLTYYVQGTAGKINTLTVSAPSAGAAGTKQDISVTATDTFGNKVSAKSITATVFASTAVMDSTTSTLGATLSDFGVATFKATLPATGTRSLITFAPTTSSDAVSAAVVGLTAPTLAPFAEIAVRDLVSELAAEKSAKDAAIAAKAVADAAVVKANADAAAALATEKAASAAALAAEKATSAKALADAKTASDAVILAKDATIAKLTADNAAALKSIKDAFNSLAKKWNAKNPKAKVTYVK